MSIARRLPGPRGDREEIIVNDLEVVAYDGETIAAAMLAAGIDAFRWDPSGAPRAPLCNMGSCYECTVDVVGMGQVRACLTTVANGMRVRTDG